MLGFLVDVVVGTFLGIFIMGLLSMAQDDCQQRCAGETPAPQDLEDWGPPRDELKAESSSFTAKELGTLK